jgi:hypothetical protein
MPPAAVLALPSLVFAFPAPARIAVVIVIAMEPAIVIAAIVVTIVVPSVVVMVAGGRNSAARQRDCQSQCCQFNAFHISPSPVASLVAAPKSGSHKNGTLA